MHLLSVIGVFLYWMLITMLVIRIVMDNRQPAKTMAWGMVMFFVPVIGLVLYFFFGMNTRKERLISQRSLDLLSKRSMLGFVKQDRLQLPQPYRPVIDLFVNQNFSLPFQDNELEMLTDGYSFFLSLLSDLRKAKSHIHIDVYIFEDDALGRLVRDVLIDKAREGVEVRVIYDDVGCWNVKNEFFERMREEGIEVAPFLPVRFPLFTSKANYRNHRKIIVIDGRVGYVGGMNIALRYVKGIRKTGKGKRSLPWRDTMVRMTGGVVYALQRAFLVDWFFVDRTLISGDRYYPIVDVSAYRRCLAQVVTSSPAARYPEMMQGYVRIILAARQYIYIETPYFLPNEPVLFALKTAATAGVDVRIIVPRHNDARLADWAGRSYLREVAEAGVKVFLYDNGFMHAKSMVCDGALSTVGSTNIDFRSFENNFEANVFVYDDEVARQMKEIFLIDQQQSIPLEKLPRLWHPRFLNRFWESLTRLLSPLL
jgi:cardiolipin synthase